MSNSIKTDGKPVLRRIEGHAHLFTFDNITRNPKEEKKVIARIIRQARRLRTLRTQFFANKQG